MSTYSSKPPKEAHEAEMEGPEPHSDCADPASQSTPTATSMLDEAFAEELLREAHLPRDGGP